MRILTVFLLSLFSFSAVWAQDEKEQKQNIEKDSYEAYDERPYPATNVPVSEQAADFIALFQESDVGNLRLYAHPDDELPYGYPFAGDEIPEDFYSMFTGEYRELLEDDLAYAYSVYSIKGNEGQHYIMRLPTDKGPNTLVLFDLQGEVMVPVQVLAFAYCQEGYCYQQDSFITDLDGDTDLDILLKFERTMPETEEVMNKNDIMFLQQDNGEYRMVLDNPIEVDPGMYNMKEVNF
ncbi:MAG: hypothetical protein GVY26_06265 [Bacteroidetes bacterium]|jgi:hypothetical protein|nr:hypothetical protein [Bacteroidota bacterium]